MLVVAAFVATSCSDDAVDPLTGKYAATSLDFTTATVQPTVKLKKGIKSLNVNFEQGDVTLQVSFGSSEWILPANTYNTVDEITTSNELKATLVQGGTSTTLSGKLFVDTVDSIYCIRGLLTDAAENRYKVNFNGPLEFIIGEDDPEASGYTIAIKENTVTDANGTTYDGVTKYAITVSNPSGVEVAEFDAVNKSGLTMDDLAGTYTIQSYPTESGLMDAGWVFYYPDWGVQMAGGSYFTDANGAKQYITNGQITITKQEGIDGNTLYSFSGEGLSTLNAVSEAGSDASFKILFATYTQM